MKITSPFSYDKISMFVNLTIDVNTFYNVLFNIAMPFILITFYNVVTIYLYISKVIITNTATYLFNSAKG